MKTGYVMAVIFALTVMVAAVVVFVGGIMAETNPIVMGFAGLFSGLMLGLGIALLVVVATKTAINNKVQNF